ncbi:unnamed protein product [Zymoseptoria tritici ST99CH_1E4]|uniref:Uncharacterized protein n=1 Tax=Zymoseptoria tritici ST99CH_1E4 TaxID=1276532 RepID=A0A2H1GZ43_ZYMTR|nr:unnamed protein product [Zymoseptoria tritici ST99CH_1E4]
MVSPLSAFWSKTPNQAAGDSTSQLETFKTELQVVREELDRTTTVMVTQREQIATTEQECRRLANRVDDLTEEKREHTLKLEHSEREADVIRATLYEEKMSFQNQSRPGRSAHNLDREIQAQQLRTTKNDFDPAIAKMTVKAASYSLFAVEECIKIMKENGIADNKFEHVVELHQLAIKCHHTPGMPSITASMTELAEVRAKGVAAAATPTPRATLNKRKHEGLGGEAKGEATVLNVQPRVMRATSTESNKRMKYSHIRAALADFEESSEAGKK